jgi:small-conductance mechanosensitive channel
MADWLSDKASQFWDWFTGFGLQLLWAALVIVALLMASRWLRRRLNRALRRKRLNPNVVNLINIFSKIFVCILVIIVLLRLFGVSSQSLATVIGLVSAAVTLSLQDVLKNLVAGVYLLMEQPFRVGDRIEVSNQRGIVEKVDIRTTDLRNEFDELVLVPNYKVFSEIVLNRSSKVDAPDHFAIEGITAPPSEMKEVFAQVTADMPVAKEPKLEIVKAGPIHFDYEVTVSWKAGTADRFALVNCLRERFPNATIRKVSS